MLPADVYQHMYQAALEAPEGNMVEVGCAHGAGTVCMAAGLRDSGRRGTVFTFEKIIGGTREAFGGVDENTRIILGNFAHFGVADRIELTIGDVEDCAHAVPEDHPIALLCLDADGAIDRDFALFYDQVVHGAPIVIDDVLDRTRLKPDGWQRLNRKLKVDQKHRLSFAMLDLFQKKGLLDEGCIRGTDTWFGHKTQERFASVDAREILHVYRSMTFGEATLSMLPMRAALAAMLNKVLPRSTVETLKGIEQGK
ncbi:MAG: class I SAM-dependent methyltransferase [Pseudomonadota bacterium]